MNKAEIVDMIAETVRINFTECCDAPTSIEVAEMIVSDLESKSLIGGRWKEDVFYEGDKVIAKGKKGEYETEVVRTRSNTNGYQLKDNQTKLNDNVSLVAIKSRL